MKVIFVDPVTKKVLEENQENLVNGLPQGWMIPSMDISSDIEKEVLPFGVVVAFESETSFRQALKNRVGG